MRKGLKIGILGSTAVLAVTALAGCANRRVTMNPKSVTPDIDIQTKGS